MLVIHDSRYYRNNDSVNDSFDSVHDLIEFHNSSISLMDKAGFDLREWHSNSEELNNLIDITGKGAKSNVCKFLGVKWDSNDDSLLLPVPDLKPSVKTKRDLVSEVSRIFEPIGYLVPLTIRGRILIQMAWKLGIGWDEQLPTNILDLYAEFALDVQKVTNFKIPRKLFSLSTDFELHILADASKTAYGAACYLVSENESKLVLAKAKLAPIKQRTLPQLELIAVDLGIKLGKYLLDALSPQKVPSCVVLWTDSQITLDWLKMDRHPKNFITQRIVNIKSLVPNCQFKFIPGNLNVADMLTRGLSSKRFFSDMCKWLNGPVEVFRGKIVAVKNVGGTCAGSDLDMAKAGRDGPDASMVVGGPQASMVVGGPNESNVVDDPNESNVVDGPSASNVVDGPSASNVVDDPNASNVVDGPSASNVVDHPDASKVVDGPDLSKVQICENTSKKDETSNTSETRCGDTTVVLDQQVDCDHLSSVIQKFSSFTKLVTVFGYVSKFIRLVKTKTKKVGTCKSSILSASDIIGGEKIIVKYVQSHSFKSEYDFLSGKCSKVPSLVNNLNLFLDDGIIRCTGRIKYALLSENAKYPILLPKFSNFSDLVIRKCHIENGHCGVNDLIAALRGRWWIPQIRARAKSLVRKCVVCLKIQGSHYSKPSEPPLPADRIRKSKPFSVIGIDYTGAINVKDTLCPKVYIILFTCAVTRAIHLEIAEDGSEDEFLRCFRRYVARKGYPAVAYTDNAKVFLSSSKSLNAIADSPNVMNYMSSRRISWKFIPARAAWFGGMYERLIGITKVCLKRLCGRRIIELKELRTLIVEIEARINNRPLTYVYSELSEPEPLTPSHLLTGYRSDEVCVDLESVDDNYDVTGNDLREKFSKLSKILDEFWNRWHADYLLALRERSAKTSHGSKTAKVGDIVIIHDEKPRSIWKLGVVTRVFPGIDGVVRSAKVRTSNSEVSRPLIKLYPLELNHVVDDENDQKSADNDHRSLRFAAIKAREAISRQLEQC